MAPTEPNGSLTPPKLDADARDYLAFVVTKKALQLLLVPVTLLVGVAGFFGYDVRRDLLEAQNELVSRIIPEGQASLDSLQRIQQEPEALVAAQNAQLTLQSQMSSTQLAELIRQASELGSSLVRMEAAESEVQSLNSHADSVTSHAEELQARLDSGLSELEKKQSEVEISRRDLNTSLELIQSRVFGSWSFVVHERRRTDFPALPLSVRMGTIKDNTLRDFEVSSNGAVVFDASDFPVGESRCVQASDGSGVSGRRGILK